VLRAVKRSPGYRMLRPELLTIHPADLWSEEESRLTFVAFARRANATQGRSGIAVFAVNSADMSLVGARLAEFGDDGTVAAVHTLHASEPTLPP
jgi:hypothetical protein